MYGRTTMNCRRKRKPTEPWQQPAYPLRSRHTHVTKSNHRSRNSQGYGLHTRKIRIQSDLTSQALLHRLHQTNLGEMVEFCLVECRWLRCCWKPNQTHGIYRPMTYRIVSECQKHWRSVWVAGVVCDISTARKWTPYSTVDLHWTHQFYRRN